MSALTARHLFTAAEFTRMAEAGVFPEDTRLELIAGEILEMSPIGRRHAACVRRLNNVLQRLAGDDALVDAQNPIVLDELSQPQPDLAILRPRADYYADRHPGPDDTLLLIEVADSSLASDREVKIPAYARAGIRETWLVDLNGKAVEVYRDPSLQGYRKVERFADPEAHIAVRDARWIRLPVATLVG